MTILHIGYIVSACAGRIVQNFIFRSALIPCLAADCRVDNSGLKATFVSCLGLKEQFGITDNFDAVIIVIDIGIITKLIVFVKAEFDIRSSNDIPFRVRDIVVENHFPGKIIYFCDFLRGYKLHSGADHCPGERANGQVCPDDVLEVVGNFTLRVTPGRNVKGVIVCSKHKRFGLDRVIGKRLDADAGYCHDHNKKQCYEFLGFHVCSPYQKKSIYIFQIQFLDEIRKTILTRIKNIKEKKVDEKLKYIINFIANRYYTSLLNKLNTKKGKIKSKYDDKTTTKVKSVSSPSIQTTSSSFDNDNNSIIKFEKHIEISNMENYTRLIREMSNGDIIGLHNINDITIYKKGKEEAKIIKFNSLSSSQKEMMTNCNTRNKINLEELNNNLTLQKNKSINNIIEAKESIAKKDKNSIQVAICSKEGLMIYQFSDNQKIITDTLKLSCTGCFEIKNNNYVVIGEKGIYHFEHLNPNNLDKYRIKDLPFRGCIKINDDYIALASNSILPNGEDNLYIYDTNKKKLIININYSITVGVNGLVLIDVLEEEDKDRNENKNQKENKILLCACKKYIETQKNGILIIDTNSIGEKKNLYYTFHDSDDFEVSCFCPLKIKKHNKMQKTNYFLAGGLDESKKEGMIKLYRVQYNEKEGRDKIEIECLQEIVIEANENFKGFNSNIECMMQRQSDGKIYISSSDGYLTLFSEPNLDYYLEECQILEELIRSF